MRNTTGYFFEASNDGGFTTKYWTGVPPAPATVSLSGGLIDSSFSHDPFSAVIACRAPPSLDARNTSAGAVIDDFEKTIALFATDGLLTTPPLTTSFGAPPASGTR